MMVSGFCVNKVPDTLWTWPTHGLFHSGGGFLARWFLVWKHWRRRWLLHPHELLCMKGIYSFDFLRKWTRTALIARFCYPIMNTNSYSA